MPTVIHLMLGTLVVGACDMAELTYLAHCIAHYIRRRAADCNSDDTLRYVAVNRHS